MFKLWIDRNGTVQTPLPSGKRREERKEERIMAGYKGYSMSNNAVDAWKGPQK